jgi:desulfoferrodoxin (superoxide reductase-like protein)
MKSISYLLIVAAAALYCGKGSGGGGGGDVPVATGQNTAGEQIYFSAANPGKWVDYKIDHQLAISVQSEGGKQMISVSVPFKATADHYIEAIVLVDSSNKEVAKEVLKRGDKPAAIFGISDKISANTLSVVAKCNLHDMWKSRLE